MTEDRVEGLLKVQSSILETLQYYSILYEKQQQQLEKLCSDIQKVHNLVYKLYVIPYPWDKSVRRHLSR